MKIKQILLVSLIFIVLGAVVFEILYLVWTTAPQENILLYVLLFQFLLVIISIKLTEEEIKYDKRHERT